MTWYPDHPGGVIICDTPGCTRSRRGYCSPTERDGWHSDFSTLSVRDFCPEHNPDTQHNTNPHAT